MQPVVLDTLFTPFSESSPLSTLVALIKRDSVGLDKGMREQEFKAFFDLKNFSQGKIKRQPGKNIQGPRWSLGFSRGEGTEKKSPASGLSAALRG